MDSKKAKPPNMFSGISIQTTIDFSPKVAKGEPLDEKQSWRMGERWGKAQKETKAERETRKRRSRVKGESEADREICSSRSLDLFSFNLRITREIEKVPIFMSNEISWLFVHFTSTGSDSQSWVHSYRYANLTSTLLL
ncbi:hypothetical protein YC2023_118638 [Brassica napus]